MEVVVVLVPYLTVVELPLEVVAVAETSRRSKETDYEMIIQGLCGMYSSIRRREIFPLARWRRDYCV
jgi:hypothetical protein